MNTSLEAVVLWASLSTYIAYSVWAIRRRSFRGRPVLWASLALAPVVTAYACATEIHALDPALVRLQHPYGSLLALVAVPFVATRLLSLPGRRGRLRQLLIDGMSCLAVWSAATAAADPEIGARLRRLAVLIAVDRSRSMDLVPDVEQRIRAERQVAETGMRPDDAIGVIAFGADATIEEPLREPTSLPSPARATVAREATDLEAAIRRALAEVPPDAAARIVVLSDGVATRGNAVDAAAAARAADVPVDVVALEQRRVQDIRVVSMIMPSRVAEGEAFDARIVTECPQKADLDVRILRDGEPVQSFRAQVAAGQDVLHVRQRAEGSGLHRYEVRVSSVDPRLDELASDNAASAFVQIRGPTRALVLEGDSAEATPLASSFEAAGFRTTVTDATAVPPDLAGFAAYDLVVLSDIAASDVSPSTLEALATYVNRFGGGLLLMGGDRSMGPGGYGGSPVERVSPVSFDLKQDRRRASLAEVVIIDFSGSMATQVGTHTKLDLANEAAVRSVEILGAGDRVGVLHVDDTAHWTVPLGPADRQGLRSKIRAVDPGGGGIFIDLALNAAYEPLAAEHVNLKHVLLFSDGSDAEEKDRAPGLVQNAARRGITTSVVALGKGADVPALERLSRLGGGRFYLIEDASRLPAVFAQETIAAARSAINEVRFRARVTRTSRSTRGVDWTAAPELSGYVVTIAKDRSEVVLRGPDDDPLLATWSAGIGRSAAFTSDYKSRWGKNWTSWPGAAQLFGQVARDIARTGDDPKIKLQTTATAGRVVVRAIAVDEHGRADPFRRLEAHVGGPDGWEQTSALEPAGAGIFEAAAPVTRPGAYVVTVTDAATKSIIGTTAVLFNSAEELRPTGTDRSALRRIADASGGKVRATLAGIFEDRAARRRAYRSTSPWLLALAGIALLLSVGGRRAGMPDFVARWIGAIRHARERQKPTPTPAPAGTTAALLSAKAARRAAYPTRRPLPTTIPKRGPLQSAAYAPPLPPRDSTVPPAVPPPRAPERPLSAAEILLARRRQRR